MDNWDFMEENLETARNAEGALQEQADIYASSWEAAQKKVKTAAQAIYADLLDDDFFISLTNGFATFLSSIDQVIQDFGGLKGVLSEVASFFLLNYAQKMPEALNNLKQNFMVLNGQAEKLMLETQNKTNAQLALAQSDVTKSDSFKIQAEGISKINEMQQRLVLSSADMTEQEQLSYKARIQNVQAMYDEIAAMAKENEALKQQAALSVDDLKNSATKYTNNLFSQYEKANQRQDEAQAVVDSYPTLKRGESKSKEQIADEAALDAAKEAAAALDEEISNLINNYKCLEDQIDEIIIDNDNKLNADQIKAMRAEVEETVSSYQKLITQSKQLGTLSNEMQSQAKTWKENALAIDQDSEAVEELKTKMLSYLDTIQAIANENGINLKSNQLTRLKNVLSDTGSTAQQCSNAFAKFVNKLTDDQNINSFSTKLTELDQEVIALEEKMSGMGFDESALSSFKQKAEELAEAVNKIRSSLSNAGNAGNEFPKSLFSASTAMTQFASAAMSTYALINSLSNGFKTFKDTVEGNGSVLQVFSSAASIAMATMMSWNAIMAVSNTLIKSQTALNIADKISTLGLKAATDLLCLAVGNETATKLADIVATKALALAGNSLLVTSLAVAAALAALAATVTLVVVAVKAFKDSTPEAQLAKLKEEVSELSTSLSEAKQAASDLKSSFEGYDSAVKTLSECTKGTQDWRDALLDVNNTVLELLEKYPELASYVTRDSSTGQLSISDEGKQKIQDASNQAVISAQGAYVTKNQEYRNKQFDQQSNSTYKDIGINNEYLESVVSQLGTSLLGKTDEEIKSAIIEALQSGDYEDFTKKWNDKTDNYYADKIVDNFDSIKDLINALQENTLATETENQAVADNILSGNKEIQGSKYAEEITKASGKLYEQLSKSATKNLEDSGWGTKGISKLTGVNSEAKEIFKEYAKAAGLVGATLTDTSGTDSNRTFTYTDSSGEEKTVALETMRQIKAAADASDQLAASAENLASIFSKLDESGEDYNEALKEGLINDGNLEGASSTEVNALKEFFNEKGGTGQGLDTLIGNGDGILSDEEAQAVGSESAEILIKSFEQGFKDYSTAAEDLGKNWLESTQAAFKNLNTDDLALSEKEVLGQALNTAIINSGSADLLTETFNSVPTEKADKFVEILGKIDWKETSVKELTSELDKAGIETATFDDKLQELIDTMVDSGVQAAEDLGTQYKTINDIVKGLSTGDTISAANYEKLSENAQTYFAAMMDGTYQLIGSAEKLKEAVKQEGISDYQENISKLEERGNQYSRISDYDLDTVEKTASAGEGVYDTFTLNKQLTILEAMDYEAEQLAKWQEEASTGSISSDELNKIAEAVAGYDTQLTEMNALTKENQEAIESQELSIALSYDNFKELTKAYEDGTISLQAYNTASAALDEKTDTASLDATELKEYSQYLQEVCTETEEFSNELADNQDAARTVAKSIMKMNDGIDTLADNFVKTTKNTNAWSDILKKSSEDSEEYKEAMQGTRDALADLLDTSSDFVSSDFVKDHLDEIGKAATGSETAIDNLKAALADDIIANIIIDNDIDSEASGIYDDITNLKSWLDENDLKVGATLDIDNLSADEQAFMDTCNQIIADANMTSAQANAYFDAMGFEANFVTEPQTQTQRVPEYVTETTADGENTITDIGPDGLPVTRTYTRTRTHTYQDGYYEAEGQIDAIAMAVSQDGSEVPQIKSLTKKASGSSNNYSSKNSGGKKPGKSSSGSKGSSSEPSRKDKEKRNTDEAELYHDINEVIKDVEHEMTKLDKTQEHLAGNELINSLQAENILLEKQCANYAELNRQIEERQTKLKGLLAEYGDADDYYTTYNNIQKAYNDAVDSYNALIEAYNAMSKDQQSAQENTIKAAKEDLDLRKDAMDKAQKYLEEYYTNKDSLRSNDEKKQELLYQQIENNLEAYTTEIQLELDTTDAERTLAKFLKSVNTDLKNLYKTTSEWAEEFTENSVNAITHATDTQTHLDQLEYYKDIYNNGQWGSSDDLFASESETIQAIVDAQKQVIEDGEALLDDYQDAYDDLKDALEEATDQFDDIIDDFDRINDTLDHYQKINELLYGDSATGLQNNDTYYAAAAQDSLARQNALNQYINALKERRAEALAAGYDEDDDYIKNIDDEINEKTSDLESSIESYISTIQSQLENSINMAKNVMDNAMWGGDVSDIQQEWDDKKAMAEGYYDEVEKIYQLESLENKWQSAINSASSLKTQQQLKSLMEGQVAALENKTALSEKDVELAEKEIEVYQAQIALEEAQNSKNSMKLTRDESGNWSYQYVADEDDVADKQQDYIDKLNEWRTAAMEATESIKESVLSSYTEFSERMVEIMNDVTLSDEERTQKMAELNETYYGDDGIITKAIEDSNYTQQQANKATFEELWGLYQNDTEYYEQMTETEKELVDSLRDQGISDYTNLRDFLIGEDGTSGVYGNILDTAQSVNKDCSEAWDSMAADAISQMYGKDGKMDKSSVAGIVQTAYDSMIFALDKYDQAIVKSEKASGIEWSKVDSQLENTAESIDDVTEHIQGVIDKIADLSEFEEAVLQIKAAWDEVALSVQEAISDLEYYLALLNGGSSSSSSDSDDESIEDVTSEISNDSSSASTDSNNSSSSGGGDGELSVGDTATLSGSYYYDSTGTAPAGSKYSGVENGVVVDKINSKYGDYSYHIHSADGAYTDLGWVKKSQLSGYDTGGYTGDWNGGDGRLALLHSKELVLNSSDTSNILNAVSAIRSIASMGDITSTIASGVASLVKNMLGFNSNTSGAYGSDSSTEISSGNVFNISAEFPNANNADEIREAILSLPTLASQYLSRNGR